jgi:hypothetical protein
VRKGQIGEQISEFVKRMISVLCFNMFSFIMSASHILNELCFVCCVIII